MRKPSLVGIVWATTECGHSCCASCRETSCRSGLLSQNLWDKCSADLGSQMGYMIYGLRTGPGMMDSAPFASLLRLTPALPSFAQVWYHSPPRACIRSSKPQHSHSHECWSWCPQLNSQKGGKDAARSHPSPAISISH